MFKPTERPFPLCDLDEWKLNKIMRKKRPITPTDAYFVFSGCPIFVKVIKVIKNYKPSEYEQMIAGDKRTRAIMRHYSLLRQKDEFICDMFDISLNHKIVAVAEPNDIFIEETDENDMNIDVEMIEAIVGRIY